MRDFLPLRLGHDSDGSRASDSIFKLNPQHELNEESTHISKSMERWNSDVYFGEVSNPAAYFWTLSSTLQTKKDSSSHSSRICRLWKLVRSSISFLWKFKTRFHLSFAVVARCPFRLWLVCLLVAIADIFKHLLLYYTSKFESASVNQPIPMYIFLLTAHTTKNKAAPATQVSRRIRPNKAINKWKRFVFISILILCLHALNSSLAFDDGDEDNDDEVGDEKPIEWSVAAIERPNQWNCLRAYVSTLAHSRKYKKKNHRPAIHQRAHQRPKMLAD